MTNNKEDQNGFHSSLHGTNPQTNNSIPFRIAQNERSIHELELFSDELRLAKMLHEEQIKTLKVQHENVDNQLHDIRKSQLDVVKTINERISEINKVLTDNLNSLSIRFEKNLGVLSGKFDENRSYFSRWFLTIVLGVLVSVIFTITTFLFTGR